MEIRKLTINDYDVIVRLWAKAGLPHKPKGRDSRNEIAAQMKANPKFFLGAFENNQLIGTVFVSSDTRKGWINRLAVDPRYRRHGIAKALISESEKILRKHGIRIFCAQVEDYNTVSQELFRKCGYVAHRDVIYFTKRDTEDI